MAKTNISVSEADIDDALIQQHMGGAAPQRTSNGAKTVSIKLPTMPRFKRPSFKGGKVGVLVVAGVLVLLAAGGTLGYNKYTALRKENERLANPQAAAQDEAKRVKSEVAQLIELPNEDPTIATVVDVDKLKNQSFFANAQNGDRVLLFASAKKAVLYRPSTHKIVEVAPINIGDSTASSGTANGNVAGTSTTQKTTTTPTTTTTKKP